MGEVKAVTTGWKGLPSSRILVEVHKYLGLKGRMVNKKVFAKEVVFLLEFFQG